MKEMGAPLIISLNINQVVDKIQMDKKNLGGEVRWSLPSQVGTCLFDLTASEINIRAAVASVIQQQNLSSFSTTFKRSQKC